MSTEELYEIVLEDDNTKTLKEKDIGCTNARSAYNNFINHSPDNTARTAITKCDVNICTMIFIPMVSFNLYKIFHNRS